MAALFDGSGRPLARSRDGSGVRETVTLPDGRTISTLLGKDAQASSERPGFYAEVTCPDCGKTGPAHWVIGKSCPPLWPEDDEDAHETADPKIVEKAIQLAKRAARGDSAALVALVKAFGTSGTAELIAESIEKGF